MSGFYWLASYPKSGNTWLRIFLQSLSSGGDAVDINALTVTRNAANSTHFEQALDIEPSDLTDDEIARARPRQYEIEAQEANVALLRKVHDAWEMTPAGEPLFPVDSTLGAIYIVRDPRDVAVSLAHHMGWTVDQAIAFMAEPAASLAKSRRFIPQHFQQHLSTWSRHVESWLDAPVGVHLLRYEDVLANPVARFGEVAHFLGFDASSAVLEAAVNAVSFQRLRAAEDMHGFAERMPNQDRFFRSGIAGGWRNSLSSEQIDRIEADHGPMMRRLGYL